MKLKNTADASELDVKKYPMPTKGTAGTANINGEEVVTMFTSGRGNEYTYFRIKNVDMYVSGKLDPAVAYELELPEGFGSDTAPAARKSYYVRKRPTKNVDGSIAMGENGDPANAPHTEVRDGQEVAVNPDGSLVDPDAQKATVAEGNVPKPDSDNPGQTEDGQAAETDPAGNPLEGVESTEPTEAPKGRSRRK